MVDYDDYSFGAGGKGITSKPLAEDLWKLSDASKQEKAANAEPTTQPLEQKVGENLKGMQAPVELKFVYLQRRIKELEAMAAQMDKAKNFEAARNYRRAAAYAKVRVSQMVNPQ